MSSAVNDNSITNNGLVGVSSANQIGKDNYVDRAAMGGAAGDDFLDRYHRDWRSQLPSWLDWISGYDRAFENAKYEQWLSDTAIQRRIADAKLAGINPLFAIHGASGADGASTSKTDTSKDGAKNAVGTLTKLALLMMLLL